MPATDVAPNYYAFDPERFLAACRLARLPEDGAKIALRIYSSLAAGTSEDEARVEAWGPDPAPETEEDALDLSVIEDA